jgi:hypothetical protein
MAASTKQGQQFTLFLAGLTLACAGVATMASGLGKALLIIGLVLLGGSLFGFLRLKPKEGRVAQGYSSPAGKFAGAGVALLGWLVTVIGLQFVTGATGRIVLALIGIGISLYGILHILPTTFNKNAIWKS